MNNLHPFAGYFARVQVFESPLALETVPPKLTWIDRVIAWNPCNKELLPKPTTKPGAYMIGKDKFVAHPSIIAELRNII